MVIFLKDIYGNKWFVAFRDTPRNSDPFIVNVIHDREHYPKAEIVGDADPRWMLVHACGNSPPKELPSSDQKMWGSKVLTLLAAASRCICILKQNSLFV